MPQALILVSEDARRLMSDDVFKKISDATRVAVKQSLMLESVNDVVVGEVPLGRMSENSNEVSILLVGSLRDAWLEQIDNVRDAIELNIQKLDEDEACKTFFDAVGHVDSWALMPPGSWKQFTVG